MKNARIESKKVRKADTPHRVAGVQVRSGVKAGAQLGDKEFGSHKRGPELGMGGFF